MEKFKSFSRKKSNTEEFIKKSKIIHGDFYDYSESEYKGVRIPIDIILDENKIEHVRNFKFSDCRNINLLKFDFYLPKFNICVEFDGIQHFEPRELFGGIDEFNKTKKRDEIKNTYCRDNNIELIRISDIDDIKDKLKFLWQQ